MIKLKMNNQVRWEEHRSGWGYVLDILGNFADGSGILFDGLLDSTFGDAADENRKKGIIPYKEDWIGFMHSSITLCPFMKNYATLGSILSRGEFVESLHTCKGIFTLSENLADHIRKELCDRVNVVALSHPTEFPELRFDFAKFLVHKQVVHIGNWLRKITSFLQLEAGPCEKVILLNPSTLRYLGDELNYYKTTRFNFKNIEIKQHLSNEEYDSLLSQCIVFIHLCDSSAANTIIECIARSTPVLVNYSSPVVEYLGEDYPFYYTCIAEAEAKIKDNELIYKAHHYLKHFEGRTRLTRKYFLHSFLHSSIIKGLEAENARPSFAELSGYGQF
jgi:hypothetical protein